MMLNTPGLWHSEENYELFQDKLFQILQILLSVAVYIYIYIYIYLYIYIYIYTFQSFKGQQNNII